MNRDSKLFKFKDQTFAILRQNRGAILSGVLVGTTYVPFPPWALLFCLVPLWLGILENQESFKASFIRGWWTQAILSLIGFYWIAYVSHEFGYMPWPIALAVLLLFVSTVHIYIAVATGVAQWLKNHYRLAPAATVFILAALTCFGEIFWPSLFPWNLGYTFLWIKSPIAQTADIFGFQGLSLLVLLSNALVTWSLFQFKNKGQLRHFLVSLGLLLTIFGGLHFWGMSKKVQWQQTDAKLNIVQVQANIGNLEKEMAERGAGFQQGIINQYFGLTREALQKYPNADLIIWPETAFPDYLNPNLIPDRNYSSQLIHFLDEIKKPLITGGLSSVSDPSGVQKFYNALFLFDAKGVQANPPYHKTDLLVFGEYTPLTDYFPWLTKISPAGEGWSKGNGPTVFNFQDLKIGPQICYESLYPEFSAELANKGADFLVNLTNDSWFGPTFEPHQHMIMTLARALETRRPLLRTTNTGITTAILADGTILEQSPSFEPWFGNFEISFKKQAPQTFYSQYHSWLPLILLLIVVLSFMIGKGRANKNDKQK